MTAQSNEALKQPPSRSWGQITPCYKDKLGVFVGKDCNTRALEVVSWEVLSLEYLGFQWDLVQELYQKLFLGIEITPSGEDLVFRGLKLMISDRGSKLVRSQGALVFIQVCIVTGWWELDFLRLDTLSVSAINWFC